MIHKTKGIVLRSIKYGETSLVVTVFTELFGVQTYLLNGVRSSKKSSAKANYFLPGAILDLQVYHSEQKNMQRIKEFGWAVLYKNLLSDVIKNCIALYMVELLGKCLKQPEQQSDLFYFCEESLLHLDVADNKVTANFALYFTLNLPQFFGFKMNDGYSEQFPVLDLQEGCFINQLPIHSNFIDGENATLTSQLLKVMQPDELSQLQLNHLTRRKLLLQYQDYFALHISDFGKLKTLAVLNEVL